MTLKSLHIDNMAAKTQAQSPPLDQVGQTQGDIALNKSDKIVK